MSDVSGVSKYFATANESFSTTLGAPGITAGAATVPLAGTTGLTTGSVFVGIIEPGATNQQVFTGTVDVPGVQITNVVWTRGTNVAHTTGVAIVDYTTGTAFNMITTGILKEHTQAGAHAMTSPKITTDIKDSNGNSVLKIVPTTSAVNEVTVQNSATGNPALLYPSGSDSNINLKLTGKGTGSVDLMTSLTNPYKFSVYAGATTIIASLTFTKIAFNTKEYDTGSNFDSATNYRFTAPVAGFYKFDAALQTQSGGSGEFYQINLYKNGAIIKSGQGEISQSTNLINITVSPPPLQLLASDYIEVFAYQNTGGSKTVTSGQAVTYFGGFLVSAT